MTTEYYKNFITIVECGNILAASRQLLVAQPALSNQLKSIEKEYGAKLLTRGGRTVQMTEAGRIFYQKAKTIVALEKATKKEIEDSIIGVAGTLSIILPPTNSDLFLQKCFTLFAAKYPNVNYDIHELSAHEAALAVESGVAEIAIVCAPIANPHLFNRVNIEEEAIKVIVPKNHALSKKDELSLEDLQGQSLIVPRGCLSTVTEMCASGGFKPTISTITTSRSVALSITKIKNMLAVLSVSKYDCFDKETVQVKGIQQNDIFSNRALISLKSRKLSAVATNFINSLSC